MCLIFSSSLDAEFLDVFGTKVLRVFLLAIHSHLFTNGYYSPSSLSKSGLKLICNVNIVYGKLKSKISQDYAQKPKRNCTFMNSATGQAFNLFPLCWLTYSRKFFLCVFFRRYLSQVSVAFREF
jgi:hypothetical protein